MTDINTVVDTIMQRVEAGEVNISWRSYARQVSPSQREGSRRGHGTELHGYKIYDPADGDNANDIDHIASASESEDDIFILRINKQPAVTALHLFIDVNKSLRTGTGEAGFKSYLSGIAAGASVRCAEKYRDRTSVITYSDQPITYIKLAEPRAALYPAIYASIEDHHGLLDEIGKPRFDLISWFKNRPEVLRAAFKKTLGGLRNLPSRLRSLLDLKRALRALVTSQPTGGGLAISIREMSQPMRSVYVIVSDFVTMNDEDWDELQACAADHDTVAVFIQDKRERELPRAPFPGMSYRVTDFRGQTLSLWIVPDRLPFGLRHIGGALRFLFGWLLAKPLTWLFGKRTTREQWAENFRTHEEAILGRLQECGVFTVVMRTDDEEAVVQLLQVLASTSR